MQIRIALAGNPNCGKTTMFNVLTGSAQYVGNWPGVTVEKKEGYCKGDKSIVITDLPGTQLYTSPDPEAAQPAASAFCLEPQFNPDSPHHADWPSTTLRPGEVWDHTITLAFGVE